ncbi:alkylphosphonate utilization protein [Nocardioides humilatus]|uniref:Alkylphosphonate utilization protein n=1 Tax=Nocardioides humilatus TaxID=2607660 RepID=A0A5B1LEZ9_9ACTN|nr:zinc ribbon domain-containing protein YjdM [Nocardioides humilatus]KAA1418894.1 alkylphosphonate utilization protein [Nocardioides humilatus]
MTEDDHSSLPPCPECGEPYTYQQGHLLVCPMCAHEWTPADPSDVPMPVGTTDAFGTPLVDGDTVTVIKDLKVKGSSLVVKVGTKVRNIRIANGFGGHDIDCKIDGIGPMQLKSEFVKKA